MAVLKERLRRKNPNGTYDTIHMETSDILVQMEDGSNLRTAFATKMDKHIVDDSFDVTYTLGIDSGALYIQSHY